MVDMSAAAAPETVAVRLAGGASSGLASIVQQYLEQQLAESGARRSRAARIRGRLALTATDYKIGVTLEFAGEGIAIWDGAREPLDASIAGPYAALTELIQGRSNPLIEHLRGRLKVNSKLRNLFLPIRLHRLMRLEPERAN
jgi:SCP-2 sterol transfer family